MAREDGVKNVTVDEIANRSGTSKATIYRWWRSKEELIIDALAEAVGPVVPPDTGTLRGDLEQLIVQSLRGDTLTSNARIWLLMEVSHDPKLAEACRAAIWEPRRRAQRAVLERWIDRGELSPDLDVDLAIEAIMGPFMYRVIYRGEALDDGDKTTVPAIVDALLRGLAAP